ncbi:MAG: PIG-L family deacetylase [Flavobacteriales bacterium]|nr:PIG-L family deacetylase [Flavobacteriales bacterium]
MHFDHSRTQVTIAALLTFTLHLFALHTFAQRPPEQPNAAEILHKMQKLNVLGSVLYVVAHPDDENTKLIAWLANGKKVRTGNLSLTRGDGGQNLIGPELGDALGIIRTQELLEARRIDGGEQFFTRAVDFGYSKTAEESFEKWGKQEVLSDVVRVIRMFRPDVIITRFPNDGGGGHGHHTASAILAHEAFDLAGDPNAFPEQLEQGLEVWQPRRLFFNGSTWWRKDLAEFAKTDKDWFSVDVGGYDPLLGLSYTEIAGRSRSMHKSQGFGAAETRGEQLEYLHFEKGDRPKGDDIFEGIDMTWGRLRKEKDGGPLISSLLADYSLQAPEKSLVGLWRLARFLDDNYGGDNIPSEWMHWYRIKRPEELEAIINACMGMVSEANCSTPYITTQDSIRLLIQFFPRLGRVDSIGLSEIRSKLHQQNRLRPFVVKNASSYPAILEPEANIDQPYWLARTHGNTYDVDPHQIGRPVDHSLIRIAGEFVGPDEKTPTWTYARLFHKWVDRVDGECIRPVYVTPVASIIPKTDIVIARGGTQTIEIEVEALTDSLSGQLNVTLPEGWGTTKDLKLVNIAKRNERQSFTFQLFPGEKAKAGAVKFEFRGPKGKADRTLHEIDYPHIMAQVYYTPAEVKLIPLDVKVNATHVGYIKGAGDDVPQAIERLGVTVDMIDPSTATLESISKYDAIVVGIRAYNTEKAMAQFNPVLMQFVENGGTVVAQYNTRSRDMMVDESKIGPYPFQLSRDRVTVEEAPPTFLQKDHALLNTPNKINLSDFDGWVQERGLYFVGERDPKYTALISWNDPGEDALDGALITCEYGKGRYVYTGISFFRELPAGVAGAYRLFANMISLRSDK